MGEDRGPYRSIHSVLTESREFVALSPQAKLVFYTLRCCKECNLACIFPFYPETLPGRTGLPKRECDRAWDSLSDGLWITYQYPVLWIRNGLRFNPGISLRNEKHVTAIRSILVGFPRLEIIGKFCSYYGLPIPPGYPIPGETDSLSGSLYDTRKKEEGDGEGRGKGEDCADREPSAPTPAPDIDPLILEILQDCQHLARLSNGDSAGFWDQFIAIIQPYELGQTWVNGTLRRWNQWFEDHPKNRSQKVEKLRSRLMWWLKDDLDKAARRS